MSATRSPQRTSQAVSAPNGGVRSLRHGPALSPELGPPCITAALPALLCTGSMAMYPADRMGEKRVRPQADLATSARRRGRLLKASPVSRIADALLFRPVPHADERGFFSRTFDSQVARDAGIDPAGFVQDSQSRSVRGVVRGMHVRGGAGEAKLVRCSYGVIFDVIVDLRAGSPTYLNWERLGL